MCYECITIGDKSYKCAFCIDSWNIQDCYYCDTCINSKHCFACIGLNGKEYCIFNIQYGKEDYEKKVSDIIESMIVDGTWGEFFPSTISPLAYNETPAHLFTPLSQQEVQKR